MTEHLNLIVTREIIDKAKDLKIHSDHFGTVLIILFALYEEKVHILDHLDDENKERLMMVLYEQMVRRGLLDRSIENKNFYELTTKGVEFVQFAYKQYPAKPSVEELIHSSKGTLEANLDMPDENDVVVWIDTYLKLFPTRNDQYRMLRFHADAALRNMQVFLKENPSYTKSTILSATEMYIKNQALSLDGHMYTKNSTNFIQKVDKGVKSSDLKLCCEAYLDKQLEKDQFDKHAMDII